ncbi:MAG TPA: T9SS type A sorting domain-containing protein [Chitinophagaceae bacterium]|nr:T9SS type A sorting domain-containing protein [Chitinophagaceae bacterium]
MRRLHSIHHLKLIMTLVLLLYFSSLFSQWARVQQLPASDIFSLYKNGSTLYAGGRNLIYFSSDKGQTWDSTTSIPLFTEVSNIIVYKNELYASSFSIGVSRSSDGGRTWQNISTGIFPEVSDFVEWRGDLYAATLGASVFKLDPVSGNNWLSFSNGLSSLSANITTITGNNNALVAGTLANALYDYLPVGSTTWEERFLLGQVRPTEGAYDIVTGHDSLFLSGSTGRFYMSTDNGLNWRTFGGILPSLNSTLVNARQALLLSRVIFDGVIFHTSFSYLKKDSLQDPFVPFSVVSDHYTYRSAIFGDKLWDASTEGLFFMSLSNLPGISADDTTDAITLPVQFVFFNANCESEQVLLRWRTAQELNSSHFSIERSNDAIHWTEIGSLPSAGTSNSEKSYSFADNNLLPKSYYRIAQFDLDGKVQYSEMISSSCSSSDIFNLWPNPVRDLAYISVVTPGESQAIVRVFDSKGSLVKLKKLALVAGSNLFTVDLQALANGVYTVSVEWSSGQMKKALQVLKQ